MADRLTDPLRNPTIYQYGYLHQADELCYWHRELTQATNAVDGDSALAPACI